MRMRILVGCAAIILGVIGMPGQAPKPAAVATVTSADGEKTFFSQYCYGCHNQAAKTRGVESALRLTLDQLDPAHVEKDPEVWEKVVRKLRAGMMPPSGMPRPNCIWALRCVSCVPTFALPTIVRRDTSIFAFSSALNVSSTGP